MSFFPCAHASHPLWSHAVRQVVVQLEAQMSLQNLKEPASLGLVYLSVPYAEHAGDIVGMLSKSLPEVQHWVGCAVHSVLAGDMDYGHAGAIAVMLPYLDEQDYQVFTGIAPPAQNRFSAQTALIHGDAWAPGVVQQIHALQEHWKSATLVGGLCDLKHEHAQWSWGARDLSTMPSSLGCNVAAIQKGGLSGIVFSDRVDCVSVGMHGCKPVSGRHTMTKVDGHAVLELDGKPALEVFYGDMNGGDIAAQRKPSVEAIWQRMQHTLMASTPVDSYANEACLSTDARVLRVVSVNPWEQAIVLDGTPVEGQALSICQPDAYATRAEMRRACAEVWELLTASATQTLGQTEPTGYQGRSICGAVYLRSQFRDTQTRSPRIDAELQWIRHALGPVPLLGFSSSHEIDSGDLQHLSAQLLVFTRPLQALS